ncbi:MAG: hypothetical protein ACRC5T_03650 [Cetobacterium sp.]
MSEDSASVQQPDTFTSPLRTIMLEMHEIYNELVGVGFSERASTSILGHMMLDIMLYRSEPSEDTDEDDEDFDDIESDNPNDSGPE